MTGAPVPHGKNPFSFAPRAASQASKGRVASCPAELAIAPHFHPVASETGQRDQRRHNRLMHSCRRGRARSPSRHHRRSMELAAAGG